MAISFRFAWQSLVHGSDPPPSTMQEDGISPGRLPNLLLNWALKGLTAVVDNYLADLSKKYECTRWISHGMPRGIFSLRQVSAPWDVVWQKIDFSSEGPNQQAAEDSGSIIYYLDSLPRGSRVTGLRTLLKGATGHTGLPSTMPKMRIVVYQRSDLAVLSSIVATDAASSVAAYEGLHSIDGPSDLAAQLAAYDPAETRVVVQVFGEAGTGGTTFKSGLQVYGVEVTYHADLAGIIQSATVVP